MALIIRAHGTTRAGRSSSLGSSAIFPRPSAPALLPLLYVWRPVLGVWALATGRVDLGLDLLAHPAETARRMLALR